MLTEDEEQALDATRLPGSLDWPDVFVRFPDLAPKVLVGQLRSGRLPHPADPGHSSLAAEAGEHVYVEVGAALMHNATARHWEGGSRGVSVPVFRIKGLGSVRYRTGSTRGHVVTDDLGPQVQDAGILSVTDRRVVFLGQKKTLDLPLKRVLEVAVISGGLRLNVSGRQNAIVLSTVFAEAVELLVERLKAGG
jgi:hypothetical protein